MAYRLPWPKPQRRWKRKRGKTPETRRGPSEKEVIKIQGKTKEEGERKNEQQRWEQARPPSRSNLQLNPKGCREQAQPTASASAKATGTKVNRAAIPNWQDASKINGSGAQPKINPYSTPTKPSTMALSSYVPLRMLATESSEPTTT